MSDAILTPLMLTTSGRFDTGEDQAPPLPQGEKKPRLGGGHGAQCQPPVQIAALVR